MIRRISDFEEHFIVNRPMYEGSSVWTKIRRTCDNCYEKKLLCLMSNGIKVCEECSKDIETLTNRLPPTSEK